MNIKIIKTSTQAKAEKEQRIEESKCPECGYYPNLSVYHYEGGLFSKQVKVNTYTCINCKCQWEVRN